MQYRNLSDVELELETKKSVLEETKIQTKVLHLFSGNRKAQALF